MLARQLLLLGLSRLVVAAGSVSSPVLEEYMLY